MEIFLNSLSLQKIVIGGVLVALVLLITLVLPRLKKEVIGKPESDWMMVGVNSPTFSTAKQVESEIDILEQDLTENFGNEFLYTFTQIQGTNNGFIMLRLKDKKKVEALVQKAEDRYKNTPTKFYWVEAWNPSELEIPDPPDFVGNHWR